MALTRPRFIAYEQLSQTATRDRYTHHIAALSTTPPVTGKQGSLTKFLLGPNTKIWKRSTVNEWGRLLEHGIGKDRPKSDQVNATGTIFFTNKSQVPEGRKVTYANFICNIRPQKTETHRVRMTARGNKLDYPDDASSPPSPCSTPSVTSTAPFQMPKTEPATLVSI
jgi:hypothetical protein